MAIPKVCGIETEYGIQVVGGDPNPIAASSVLINAYAHDVARQQVGWDFEDEAPGNDARGFAREGAMPPMVETHLVNTVLTNGPVLKFAMQSNLVLQANFVTNPFLVAAGSTYYGLFAPTAAPRQNTNSGAIHFTLGTSGSLSGAILLGPDTLQFSTNFDISGSARINSPRGSGNPVPTQHRLCRFCYRPLPRMALTCPACGEKNQ